MTDPRAHDSDREQQLTRLFAAAADAEATTEDIAALDDALRTDEPTRAEYLRYQQLNALLERYESIDDAPSRPTEEALREICETVEIENSDDSLASVDLPPRRFRASRHKLGISISVAVAVVVSGLLAMHFMDVGRLVARDGKQGDQPLERAKPEHVARLTNWQNSVWLEDTRPPLRDPRLEVGKRLVLESGTVEISYFAGARVVIEGPAEFEVLGKKRGYLTIGRLAAHVDGEKAEGFTIDTPTAAVEDLGTEFGIEVDRDGTARVDVLEGVVRTHVRDGSGGIASVVTLAKDQALRISRTREVVRLSSIDRRRYMRLLATSTLADLAQTKNLIIDDLVDENNGWAAPQFDRNQFGKPPGTFITPTAMEGRETAVFRAESEVIEKSAGFDGRVLEAGTYTIQFSVGNYSNYDGDVLADIDFAGMKLSDAFQRSVPQPRSGGWSLWTIRWDVDAANPNLGKPLNFRFTTADNCTNGTFDGVGQLSENGDGFLVFFEPSIDSAADDIDTKQESKTEKQ